MCLWRMRFTFETSRCRSFTTQIQQPVTQKKVLEQLERDLEPSLLPLWQLGKSLLRHPEFLPELRRRQVHLQGANAAVLIRLSGMEEA